MRTARRGINLRTTDFLIVVGGVVGLNLAVEIRRRYPGAGVSLLGVSLLEEVVGRIQEAS